MSTILLVARIIYVLHYNIDLHSEEAQYWLWSKHPGLSYYSKPPLIAWMNYLSTAILGDTELGIRINSMAIGFILPLLMYFLSKQMANSARAGYISVIVLFGMPFYHYTSLFFTTDSLLIMFWLLTLLFYWYAINNNKWTCWVIAGLFLGMGFLSKYTILLFLPFLFLYLYLYKRSLLQQPGLYLSLLTALIFSSPVVLWNLQNEFYGMKHIIDLSGLGEKNVSLDQVSINILEYILSQILILSPFFLPFIYKVFTRKLHTLNKQHAKPFRYLRLSVITVWLFFFFVALKKIEINWLLFVYPAVPALIGLYYFHTKKLKIVILPAILSFLTTWIFLTPVLFDKIHGSSLYPPQTDTFYRMSGWEELGDGITKIIRENEPAKTFVFSDSYHIASQLSFYIQGQPQTYVINLGRRMNQFDLWKGMEQFRKQEHTGIFVSGNSAPEKLQAWFRKTNNHYVYERTYRGATVQKMHVYVFKDLLRYKPTQPNNY